MNRKLVNALACFLILFGSSSNIIYAETINSLESDVEQANDEIAENNDKISEQEEIIKSLNKEIESLDTEIDTIRTEFEANEKDRQSLISDINEKEADLEELNKDLEKRMEVSSSLLTVLQRNSNINYIVDILYNDTMSPSEKIMTINSFNQLSVHSFNKLRLTIELIDQVETEQAELETVKQNLDNKQSELQVQGAELQAKADEQYALKEQALTSITELESNNSSVKSDMLEANDLIAEYELAGCSGDDVYGTDCGNDSSSDSSSSSDGYAAKLRANADANFIINAESGWNVHAENPYSGAYGICQALPGSKMASAGSDWQDNIDTQAKWCDSYVMGRYGSWSAARSFWESNGWF